jgi:hypothetical protein
MKKYINFTIPILILIIAGALTLIYQTAVSRIQDSRKHTDIVDKVIALSKDETRKLQKGRIIRYTVYTHAETVYRNELTGKYLDEATAENYSIEDIDKIRRLKNVEFIYEDRFKDNGYAITDDYIIIKGLRHDELYLNAYLRYDPTIEQKTRFWYNGEILTSIKTMHTFNAYTGKGISTDKSLTPLLIEKEIRRIQ